MKEEHKWSNLTVEIQNKEAELDVLLDEMNLVSGDLTLGRAMVEVAEDALEAIEHDRIDSLAARDEAVIQGEKALARVMELEAEIEAKNNKARACENRLARLTGLQAEAEARFCTNQEYP